jgi:hypothetical protein
MGCGGGSQRGGSRSLELWEASFASATEELSAITLEAAV